MKLRKINVTGILAMLVFESGSDSQRAIWNHICDGTSCLADSFDTSIKHLLNAHGVNDIHIIDLTDARIIDLTPKKKAKRGCETCRYIATEKTPMDVLLVGCGNDPNLEHVKIDLIGIESELEIKGKINFATKKRATLCDNYGFRPT